MQEKNIVVCVFQSVGGGIKDVQSLLTKVSLEIIEAAPISPGRYLLIAESEDMEPAKFDEIFYHLDNLDFSAFIPDMSPDVLKALYHLQNLEEFSELIVLEGPSLPDLLYACNDVIKNFEGQIQEIQTGRGLSGHNFAVIGFEKVPPKVSSYQRKNVLLHAIKKVHPTWKEYYL